MGYDNVLFNGKSMRNAIITKLSEDKHLTSALFANSNITILVDIISYMYQCLMSNLRQAASESMWSDTIFFENATRLARLIGYYAKGQIPFTMLAKKVVDIKSEKIPDFGKVSFSYGPYEYDFAVVEEDVNGDQSLLRLALGKWKSQTFISDGIKFQEFIVENHIENYDHPSFISQKFVRVKAASTLHNDDTYEWTYSPDPLFILQNSDYTALDANPQEAFSRTMTVRSDDGTTKFNFYINENGDYVLKFGDGISTDIPPKGSKITIYYIESTETDVSVTASAKTALSNATESEIHSSFNTSTETDETIIKCIPISPLSGYRKIDDAETIRKNSRQAFSRQNRLVTKEDYRTFLLENYPEWEDITVQNNWEYVSTFYGWLYTIAKAQNKKPNIFINTNKLERFNSSDLADANNIYVWVLDKNAVDLETVDIDAEHVGIIKDYETQIDRAKSGNSLGAIKDITEHPIFLNAICKRFLPFADPKNINLDNIIDYNDPNPFRFGYSSFFRIHVDSTYANTLNVIKSKTFELFRSYLFDNIKLGQTPNVPALIKDLMSIDGVINVTTVFNSDENIKNNNIESEVEVPGMKFCTWTDTDNQLVSASDDVAVAFNLPNIPCFQYFKAAQTYQEFIDESIDFKIDYSIKS